MRFVAAILAALLFGQAHAADVQLVAPPDAGGGTWLLSAAGGSTLYGASNSNAGYHAAQWDSLADMSNLAPYTCPGWQAGCWSAWSQNVNVDQYSVNGQLHFLLRSNGTGMPCSPSAGAELDTFLSSNDQTIYKNYPTAVVASVGLGSISALNLSFTVWPRFSEALPGTDCAVTHSNLAIAIVLSNASAHQTIFYQFLVFGDNTTNGTPFWYDTAGPGFGYDDYLAGAKGLPTAAPYSTTIDVLPKLTAIITGGGAPGSMDTTLANWTTGIVYVGNVVYGHRALVSEWSGITLRATQ